MLQQTHGKVPAIAPGLARKEPTRASGEPTESKGDMRMPPEPPANERPHVAPEPRKKIDDDPLDPATRHAAQLAPLLATSAPAAPPPNAVEVRARASLDKVLPALVKRVAWSGDGRRGVVRLEFGAGSLAGGTLIVHADDGRLRVELTAPAGANPAEWKERITARLLRRGLSLDDVRVD
jgi:hypothetical protein